METFNFFKTNYFAVFFICLCISLNLEAQQKIRIVSAKASSTYSYTTQVTVKKDAGFDIGIGLGDALKKDGTKTVTHYCGPEKAIDGNTNGHLRNGSSVYHSKGPNPWWEADLGAIYDVSKVKLFNRTDGWSDRLANFYIMISERPIRNNNTSKSQYGNGPMDAESESYYEVKDNKKGRYIRIFIDDHDTHLQLAEVEVYGYKSQNSNVQNNFTATTGGPNLSGSWKLNFDNEHMANFNINTGSTAIIINMEEGSEADPETREYFNFQNLDGEYGWNRNVGAYQKGNNKIFKASNGSLYFHYNGTQRKFELKKSGGGLSSLVNQGTGANTSKLWGKWTIEGKNAKVDLMEGASSDLVLRAEGESFNLNKISTGYPDKYATDDENVSLTFVSNSKMKLALGSNHVMLNKVGGSSGTTITNGALAGMVDQNAAPGEGADTGGVNQRNATGDTPLHTAVRKGDTENIEEIIGLGADLNAKNNQGQTPLIIAVSKEEAEAVTTLLDKGVDINATNNQGKTALEIAIAKQNDEIIDALLEQNPTISNKIITTAVKKKDTDLINTLLNAGGSASYAVDETIKTGNIKLFKDIINEHGDKVTVTNAMFDKAVSARKYPLAQVILSNGIDADQAMNTATRNNATDLVYAVLSEGGNSTAALKYAVGKKDIELATSAITEHGAEASSVLLEVVKNKDLKMATLLLDNGADANAGMSDAVRMKQLPMVQLLLDNNADPSEQLKNAAVLGEDKMITAMLEKGGDANLGLMPAVNAAKYSTAIILVEGGADANPVLPIAVTNKQTDLVKACLEAEADPQPGMTPAIEQEDADITKMLIGAGADGTAPQYISSTCTKGNAILTKILLDAGANPQDGIMPAVKGDHAALVSTLIQAGADGSDSNLLVASVKHNNTILTGSLLEAGATPDLGVEPAINANAGSVLAQLAGKGADLSAPKYLRSAVNKSHVSAAKVLFENGHNANSAVDPASGNTLLHTAVSNGNVEMTKLLLNKGADVTATTNGAEDTALHIAVAKGKKHIKLAEALILKGADVNAINAKGKLVFKVAKSMKMKRMLKKNGAVKK